MGLLKLGSKLKSKGSFGSGAFGVAEDLKGLFSQKSKDDKPKERRSNEGQGPREQFYQNAELNSHRASSFKEDKSYFSKRPTTEDYPQTNFVRPCCIASLL